MKKKKIASFICVIIILLSYVCTITSVFLDSPRWIDFLKASIFVTVVFPILLYAMMMVSKLWNKKK